MAKHKSSTISKSSAHTKSLNPHYTKTIYTPEQLNALVMVPTKYLGRPIPIATIYLSYYSLRITEIITQLIDAAENVGFFRITDHGISRESVDIWFAN